MDDQESAHVATVRWTASGNEAFTYDTFSRAHSVELTGVAVPTSSAIQYRGDATRSNPEELFVGAIASCHMLTFLSVAARQRFVVTHYEDRAVGRVSKDEQGRLAVTDVVLSPRVAFSPDSTPTGEKLAKIHDLAHRNCFIANSVRCRVRIDLG